MLDQVGRHSWKSVAAALVTVVLVAGCSSGGATSAPTTAATQAPQETTGPTAEPTPIPIETVRLITPIASSLVDVALYVGMAEGIFEKNGIRIEHTAAAGGGPDMQALLAGEVDYSFAYPGATLSAVAQNQPVVSIMAGNTQPVGNIVMRKDVAAKKGVTEESSFEDRVAALNGTKLGVSTAGSFFAQLADFFIKEYNLEGVEVIPLGGGATALAGLEQGSVDALIYSPPVIQRAVLGGSSMWLVRPSLGEVPNLAGLVQSAINVRTDYLADHEDQARNLLKGYLESAEWVKSHTPEEVVASIKEAYGFGEIEQEVLVASVEMMKSIVSSEGCLTEKGLGIVGNFLLTSGAITAAVPFEKVATNDYLPAACPS